MGIPWHPGDPKLWGQVDGAPALQELHSLDLTQQYQEHCRGTLAQATLLLTDGQRKVVAEKIPRQLQVLWIQPHSLGNCALLLRGSPGPPAP